MPLIINSQQAQMHLLKVKERVKITELKKIRQEKGITQEVLAKQAKIAIRTYKYYESGERLPDVHTAQRIANALGKDVKDLFPLPRETSPEEINLHQNNTTEKDML